MWASCRALAFSGPGTHVGPVMRGAGPGGGAAQRCRHGPRGRRDRRGRRGAENGRQPGPLHGWPGPASSWVVAPQHRDLLAQHQQLGVLRRRRTCQQRPPADLADEHEGEHPSRPQPAMLPAAQPTPQPNLQVSNLCPRFGTPQALLPQPDQPRLMGSGPARTWAQLRVTRSSQKSSRAASPSTSTRSLSAGSRR